MKNGSSSEMLESMQNVQKERDESISKFYHLINNVPSKTYWEHEYDIVDLSWQIKKDYAGRVERS
jgi:hypothetical protein